MNSRPTQPKRPFGVYAIIALLLLRVLSISLDLERIRLGLMPLTLPDLDNSSSIVVVIAITIAAILLVCIGLFLLRRWAWIAVMILIGFNLLYGIVYYLNGGQPFVSLLLDVVSVFYLHSTSGRTISTCYSRSNSHMNATRQCDPSTVALRSPVRFFRGPMDYYIKMRYNHVALWHSVSAIHTRVLSDDQPSLAMVAQLDRSASSDSKALLTYHPT